MKKETGRIEGILRFSIGKIDYTKFFPPLEFGGIARIKTAESGIRATLGVLERIRKVATKTNCKEVLEILDTPVEVEDHTAE